MKVSHLAHLRDRADLVVEDAQELLLARAHELDDDVERAGGDHDVLDLRDLSQPRGGLPRVPAHAQADRGHHAAAQGHRVGDGHDPHQPGLAQPVDPLARRRLREPDRLAELPVGPPAVLLEQHDDGGVGLVELGLRRHHTSVCLISSFISYHVTI